MLDSAGQRSDVLLRFRETVAAESLQLDHGKTRSRPPESLGQNLRQKMRGLSKTRTWRVETLKIVDEASGFQNSRDVENVVFGEQYSRARAHPTLVSVKGHKFRNTVKPLAQSPSGVSPVVLSPDYLEKNKCKIDTFITTKQPLLNDRPETQKTGRNVCFCMLACSKSCCTI